MKPRDIALAVAVNAAWGFNFVVIDTGLKEFPPLLFSALRFTLAAVPAIFFVGPPRVAWRWVFAVGGALAVAKFSLLFLGMHAGMPAGLSSIVLQSQAVFTVLFAVALLRERPRRAQLVGLAVATAGIALVGARLGVDGPMGAFALVVGAGVCWGVANVAMRRASPPDMLRFMVWVSATAPVPLLILSLLTEGPAADLKAIQNIDLKGAGALVYVAGVATLLGFGAWGALIRRYGAATVAPFSMIAPIFAMLSAGLLLREPVHATDIIGGLLVVGGVLAGVIRVDPHVAGGTTLVVEGENHGVHGGEGGPARRRDGADAAPLRRDRVAVAD
jgi:O-acetylserine/cysteine efflux transporter